MRIGGTSDEQGFDGCEVFRCCNRVFLMSGVPGVDVSMSRYGWVLTRVTMHEDGSVTQALFFIDPEFCDALDLGEPFQEALVPSANDGPETMILREVPFIR